MNKPLALSRTIFVDQNFYVIRNNGASAYSTIQAAYDAALLLNPIPSATNPVVIIIGEGKSADFGALAISSDMPSGISFVGRGSSVSQIGAVSASSGADINLSGYGFSVNGNVGSAGATGNISISGADIVVIGDVDTSGTDANGSNGSTGGAGTPCEDPDIGAGMGDPGGTGTNGGTGGAAGGDITLSGAIIITGDVLSNGGDANGGAGGTGGIGGTGNCSEAPPEGGQGGTGGAGGNGGTSGANGDIIISGAVHVLGNLSCASTANGGAGGTGGAGGDGNPPGSDGEAGAPGSTGTVATAGTCSPADIVHHYDQTRSINSPASLFLVNGVPGVSVSAPEFIFETSEGQRQAVFVGGILTYFGPTLS